MLQAEGQESALLAPDPLLDPGRLAVLRELDLLDRPPTEGLDTISRLASRLLGVPISALSLISWDRQVTAGQTGLLDEETDEAVVAPLSHSFCKHVVRADADLAITDSRENPLVRHNGAVRDSDIVAYLGVPIRLDGHCVGALCACDAEPRRWTDEDHETLTDLAGLAVEILELRRLQRDGALYDSLTGLPRRALFVERVAQLMNAREADTEPVRVVAADLRAFRLFNEAWGHEAGDKILSDVASRFAGAMGGPDRVCRLAGDEFLVAQSGAEDADSLIARLRQSLSSPPIVIDGVEQPMSALFVATTSVSGVDAAELVDDALATLSATKATEAGIGGDGHVHGPAMDRLRLRNAIVGAERRGELVLHYQPLFDLRSGEVSSLEALLRWNHPELGFVSPGDFIPVAESTGAIVPIGEWVLQTACRDVRRWRDAGFSTENLSVAVNVAPEQVRLPSFDAVVGAALGAVDLPASALALEITERTLLKDRSGERQTIEALQERGVDLHLDDFGTGYSSLGYLTQFPLEVIKIDRIFVARLGADRAATALVEGIINVAHSLGLQTVAEGIETEAQRDVLTAMGCDHGQGFFLARPQPGESITELLRERAGTTA